MALAVAVAAVVAAAPCSSLAAGVPNAAPLRSVARPCADRACFLTAAETCTPVAGSLPIFDWTGLFAVDAEGHTDITLKKAESGSCAVTLDLVVTDFRPKTDISRQKAIDRLNAAPRNHVRCLGTTAQVTRVLAELGTKEAGRATFAVCKPTRCAPVPPLDQGCVAGACTDGEWAITCGKKTCAMAGKDPEALPEGMVHACGDGPGEVRTRALP